MDGFIVFTLFVLFVSIYTARLFLRKETKSKPSAAVGVVETSTQTTKTVQKDLFLLEYRLEKADTQIHGLRGQLSGVQRCLRDEMKVTSQLQAELKQAREASRKAKQAKNTAERLCLIQVEMQKQETAQQRQKYEVELKEADLEIRIQARKLGQAKDGGGNAELAQSRQAIKDLQIFVRNAREAEQAARTKNQALKNQIETLKKKNDCLTDTINDTQSELVELRRAHLLIEQTSKAYKQALAVAKAELYQVKKEKDTDCTRLTAALAKARVESNEGTPELTMKIAKESKARKVAEEQLQIEQNLRQQDRKDFILAEEAALNASARDNEDLKKKIKKLMKQKQRLKSIAGGDAALSIKLQEETKRREALAEKLIEADRIRGALAHQIEDALAEKEHAKEQVQKGMISHKRLEEKLIEAESQITGLNSQLAEVYHGEAEIKKQALEGQTGIEQKLVEVNHQMFEIITERDALKAEYQNFTAMAMQEHNCLVEELQRKFEGIVEEARVEILTLQRQLEATNHTYQASSTTAVNDSHAVKQLQTINARLSGENARIVVENMKLKSHRCPVQQQENIFRGSGMSTKEADAFLNAETARLNAEKLTQQLAQKQKEYEAATKKLLAVTAARDHLRQQLEQQTAQPEDSSAMTGVTTAHQDAATALVQRTRALDARVKQLHQAWESKRTGIPSSGEIDVVSSIRADGLVRRWAMSEAKLLLAEITIDTLLRHISPSIPQTPKNVLKDTALKYAGARPWVVQITCTYDRQGIYTDDKEEKFCKNVVATFGRVQHYKLMEIAKVGEPRLLNLPAPIY